MTQTFDLSGNTLLVDAISTTTSSTTPITLGAAQTIKSNVASATLTGNAATVTNYILKCTTPSLTTAAGASQAETITLTGVTASDIAFVQYAGGTNTVPNLSFSAVCSTNTVTVTINNTHAASALNGTVIFNLWVLKA